MPDEVPVGCGGIPRRLLVVEGKESDTKHHRVRGQDSDRDAMITTIHACT